MRTVSWVTCESGVWCDLAKPNLSTVLGAGVYVIWQLPSRETVYVGQGAIADRLAIHRNDPNILAYRGSGTLHVTWTLEDDPTRRLSIERYLGELWSPSVSKVFSTTVAPVAVNTP